MRAASLFTSPREEREQLMPKCRWDENELQMHAGLGECRLESNISSVLKWITLVKAENLNVVKKFSFRKILENRAGKEQGKEKLENYTM